MPAAKLPNGDCGATFVLRQTGHMIVYNSLVDNMLW